MSCTKSKWESGKFEHSQFGKFTENAKGGGKAAITDDRTKGEMLAAQTPLCVTPFGPGENEKFKQTPPRYYLKVGIDDPTFRAALKDLDDRGKQYIIDNADEIIPKGSLLTQIKKNPEVAISAVWTDTLRIDEEGKYHPLFGPRWFLDIPVFDKDGNPTTEPIHKRSQIVGIVQCTGLWSVSGRFGIGWRWAQAMNRGSSLMTTFEIELGAPDADADAPPTKKSRIEDMGTFGMASAAAKEE